MSKITVTNIAENPRHKIEAEKLARFNTQLADAKQELDRLTAQHASRIKAAPVDAVAVAERFLSKGLPDTLPDEIGDAHRAIGILQSGVVAQQMALQEVNRTLCREAGATLSAQHKIVTKRIADAIQELHAANTAEWQMRQELVRLGYHAADSLPAMQYNAAHDPDDRSGSPAYYWSQRARPYITA